MQLVDDYYHPPALLHTLYSEICSSLVVLYKFSRNDMSASLKASGPQRIFDDLI